MMALLAHGEITWIHCAGNQDHLNIAFLAPRESSSHCCGLHDPEHKLPALRTGLLNSRSSCTFPSEQWRMMLPYCCRSAWSSTQLFSGAGSLCSQMCPSYLLLAPPQAGQGLTQAPGPSPSFLCSSPGTEEGGKREGAELPAQPLLPPWASKALPAPAHQAPAYPASGSQPSLPGDRAKCGFMDEVVLARPC